MHGEQRNADERSDAFLYDVFISYRRETGFYAARIIRDYLESKGLNVFMDLSKIHSGRFPEQIVDGIERCRNFILVLSDGALNNCVSEEDWLRREIEIAVDAGKHIIPVALKGFKWPNRLNRQLPEKVAGIKDYECVQENHDYFDSTLTKIVDFLQDVALRYSELQIVLNHSPSATTDRYFREHMVDTDQIHQIDMAFHAGSRWFTHMDLHEILIELLEAGKKVRILCNRPDVAESIGQHMRWDGLYYVPFDRAGELWQKLQARYPDLIEIRWCPIVLLRRYYSFHMGDKRLDTVNVKHYTYANPDVSKNLQSIFDHRSGYFKMYREEFEYLWKRSDSADSEESARAD